MTDEVKTPKQLWQEKRIQKYRSGEWSIYTLVKKLVAMLRRESSAMPADDPKYHNDRSWNTFDRVVDTLLEECNIHDHDGYAEPGYGSDTMIGIAVANWNHNVDYDKIPYAHDTPEYRQFLAGHRTTRLGDLLERAGFELEWSDEWCTCTDCNKLLRTCSNGHGWTSSAIKYNGELSCLSCMVDNGWISDYLEELENNPKTAVTHQDIDPSEYEYTKVIDDLETGMHPHQDDDPVVILRNLNELGFERVLFRIDGTGQFDITFSVWVHNECYEEKPELKDFDFSKVNTHGFSPGKQIAEALKNMPPHTHVPGTVAYTTINANRNKEQADVTTRNVSGEEFIKGIGNA